MHLQEHVPLAPMTTFRVGGPARYFVEAEDEKDVIDAVIHARANNLRLFVLGGGSNLVVADEGWPGLVLKIGIRGIEDDGTAQPRALRPRSGQASVPHGPRHYVVGAGEEWDAFVARTVEDGCAGVEALSGIPGTVGGTPVQNVGAYGQEVSETIVAVRVLDLQNLKVRELSNAECGFSYRTSIFNTTERERYIVLHVTYALTPGGAPRMAYADLQKRFANHPGTPTLKETRDAVRQIRESKAMLIVPGDDDCRSAGSFFKNPIVRDEKAAEVAVMAREQGVEREPPRYPAGGGQAKLSAAWLVENAGFPKGFGSGRVGISKKHTLAIVNRGGATAAEIAAFSEEVRTGVRKAWGIELQREPVMVGFGSIE
ncbi:MAG: UDP-N-acetylmuramate dehydrogenase [Acidobacteriales bacterium]|nr:UDP-N-acetylmuramate dehydrogenase [Terriglobales bacterium]